MITQKTPTEIGQLLAKRLKALRLRRHWSRQELAEYAKVNIYSLKRFERTGEISLTRLLSLCAALETLQEFESILKLRERIDVISWKVFPNKIRQRGRKRSTEKLPLPL